MPRPRKQGGPSANRTDRILPPTVGPSKQYGEAAQELVQQRQVPMASGEVAPAGAGGAAPPPGGGPAPLAPGGLSGPALDAPTQRPNEPVTAGLPTGPGPGPGALGAPPTDVMAQVRELYKAFPLPEIADLIAESSRG